MILFRCWYCNKHYAVHDRRAGERLTCSCQRRLRVPARSGGPSRVKTAADWLVEIVVYGGGGALLGLALAILILSQLRHLMLGMRGWVIVPALTLLGFLGGALGGERGVNWVGRWIRDWEQR